MVQHHQSERGKAARKSDHIGEKYGKCMVYNHVSLWSGKSFTNEGCAYTLRNHLNYGTLPLLFYEDPVVCVYRFSEPTNMSLYISATKATDFIADPSH